MGKPLAMRALLFFALALPLAAQFPVLPGILNAASTNCASCTLDAHSAGNTCASSCTSQTATITATAGTHIVVWAAYCTTVSCGPATLPCSSTITSVGDTVDTFVALTPVDSSTVTFSSNQLDICPYHVVSATGGSHTVTVSTGSTTVYYLAVYWASVAGAHSLDQQGVGASQPVSTSAVTLNTSGNLATGNEFMLSTWARNTGTVSTAGGATGIDSTMFFSQAIDEYIIGGTGGSVGSMQAAPGNTASSVFSRDLVTFY